MATTAASLPKTILITTLPAASAGPNYVATKIGQKRPFSIVATAPLALNTGNSILATKPSISPPVLANSNWLPATVQRTTYKYEPADDDYDDEDDSSEDNSQHYGEPEQPPRKRERLAHLTAEEKMFRRKMKNRIAAQTARDRKKALMIDLEETVRRLEEENDTLAVENTKLRQEQTSIAEENERLKQMLAEQQQQQQMPTGRDDARTVSAFGPAEGASEGRMGADLAGRIRSDPALLEILRQIVATGGATQNDCAVGAIEGERQLDIGGDHQSQPAGGYRSSMGHNSNVQEFVDETALIQDAFAHSSSVAAAVNDHQYLSSVMTSPNSSSILFSSSSSSSSNCDFDIDSFLQQPAAAIPQPFSHDDTAAVDVQTGPTQSLVIDPISTISGITSAQSPNGIVPASPALNFDTDFPQLGDDILEQALQSLSDFNKITATTMVNSNPAPSTAVIQNIGFDFLQNDDYADLAWEESFAQLFPSLSNA